jgi:hypothetical protein
MAADLLPVTPSRYEFRRVGVFDRVLGRVITTADAEWREYTMSGITPDPIPPPVDTMTLDQAVEDKVAAIEEKAAEQRAKVTGRSSPQEMASWPVKLDQARAYQTTPLAAAAPMLAVEASARGVTLADIVNRVLANASAYSDAEARIAGVSGKHKDAVRALADVAAVRAYAYLAGWPFDPPPIPSTEKTP